MKSSDIRKKYIEFFKARGHVEIPSAPLVPENDPTTLFTSSGMQPLVPYLLGQAHPSGKRLVNSQKSFRSQDIEEVGDNRHTTFFEMLGNWSLGDYFKKEQLSWIWEFLTKELGLDQKRLYVSIFEGTKDVPRDSESSAIWKSLGVPEERISYYGVTKNWWSRSGEPDKMPPGEPGGPDSEVFFDFGTPHDPKFGKTCHPNCDCGRFMEIANSVFMQYKKQADGSLVEMEQKNVDFGGGLERLVAATDNNSDIFDIDIFRELKHQLVERVKKLIATNPEYQKFTDVRFQRIRIFLDHSRAAIFLISEGVIPGKNERESVLRRLIRRADDQLQILRLDHDYFWNAAVSHYKKVYRDQYGELWKHNDILAVIINELRTYGTVFKNLEKEKEELIILKQSSPSISTASIAAGPVMFNYQSTLGVPGTASDQLIKEVGLIPDLAWGSYQKEMQKHKELSRTTSAGMFKGGLADASEQTVKLHTAHHLLLAALQKIVDPTIKQRGSNITAERLRMDFNFARKLTPEEIKNVETLVNEKIRENLPVTRVEMLREEAEQISAQMEFGHKYPDHVSVYFIGPKDDYFSAEFCGGPHVSFTGPLGRFTIIKEESAGAGVRRIYATISQNESLESNQKPSQAQTNP